ncbi:MAG TPA: tyrosine recombinase XerC [Casimicrobiaceae bacterium]|nr:tyrosine recombinase XerC [Casimicrobiaceae bacterium]
MARAAPSAEPPSPASIARIDAFGRHLAASPATTREAYVRDARILAQAVAPRDVASLQRADLARALAVLHGRGLSGRSLARMLSAWRAFYRFLRAAAQARADDPTAGLKPPKSPRRLPQVLSPDEAAKLVGIGGDAFLECRDRALFELAYSSGLRLAELAGLDIDGLDLATGEVRVTGKGSKERIVPVGRAALDAVRGWLDARAARARSDEPALFIGPRGARLSRRAIQARLAVRARAQGLDRHVHPHMLRHSFASHVLQSSGDLRAVQEMLGHASIASTQVYTHLDFQALAKAYDAAHPRARRKRR